MDDQTKKGASDPTSPTPKARSSDIVSVPNKPVKILLRIFSDGYCELYADQHVQLYVQKILSAPGITGERLGIEYADSTIPLSHRGIDDARKLVQTFDTRPVTVSQFVTVRESIGALRILDSYQARASQ